MFQKIGISIAIEITGLGGNFTGTNTVTDGTNNDVNEKALDVSTSTKAGNAVKAINTAFEKQKSQN